MYNDLIENSAAMLSGKTGWAYERSVEYIEDIIFNSSVDIPGFLASVKDGAFSMLPPARIRKGEKKAARRDLWKAPLWVQESRITGLTRDECDRLYEARRDYFCRNHSFEERAEAESILDRVWLAMDKEQRRHYCRVNEFGIWDTGRKDLMYGFVSKQAKREKYWKRRLQDELAYEGVKALSIH